MFLSKNDVVDLNYDFFFTLCFELISCPKLNSVLSKKFGKTNEIRKTKHFFPTNLNC